MRGAEENNADGNVYGIEADAGMSEAVRHAAIQMNAAREGERVGPTKSGEKGTGERRGFWRMVRKGIEEGIPRVSSGSCRVEGASL